MPRYIDANDFQREMEKYLPEDRELALKVLESIKTANVAEVVWCKDCIYGHEFIDEKGLRFRLCNNHFWHGLMVENHGFCKWGKRRTDDETV